MKSRLFLLFALLALLASCRRSGDYVQISGYAQGGVYSVKYNAAGVRVPQEAVAAAVDSLLGVIDRTLSGYNKASVLSRYNAGEPVGPDAMFDEVRARARAYRAETGGALDCAAAPLFDVWGFGFTEGSTPDSAALAAAMERTRAEEQWNFNAIAQGYSCDVVADYLRSIGVKDMLVDIGEIFCQGRNPSGKPWTIGVDRPEDGNMTPGADLQAVFRAGDGPQGIVTSGNYRKFYVRDGRKYAHTIDPRTGCPVEHSLLSATVVAPTAMDADAYATYCMVIGLPEAQAFLLGRDDLEGYLVYDDNGKMASWASPGFELLTY